ncbi:hypothetical protein MCUN1_000124 [Malassezia cuniculi]|uniref:Post-GPI attachment to proteins factor 3 n=1 Tax=Malassezia cuniculi TaxID=948313 RepID=A0AAF0ER39_9BASI|nr:hypothetical protein MCUN1_000124 [Malassezia cuniculi]
MPAAPLPWYLGLTGWTCESNCQYHCTHRVTNDARRRVQDIHNTVSRAVYDEYEALRRQHEAWAQQQAAERVGIELDYCTDNLISPDCIQQVAKPAPLPADSALKRQIRERVKAELARLPVAEKRTVQFHGKWPHLRILGMQEPLSVVFSLLNLVVQLSALSGTFGRDVPDTYPLKTIYIRHTKIAAMAWLASAVFHTRDLPWTERWDYFSAAAVLLSGLFLTVCRLFRLAPGSRLFNRVLLSFAGAWIIHVIYLLRLPRFDYGYNMTACLVVGVVHNILWLTFAVAPHTIARYIRKVEGVAHEEPEGHVMPSTGPEQRKKLIILIAAMFAAPALELFDFPPIWRTLDAHALWHLSTVPLTSLWYRWLATDAQECVSLRWWRVPRSGRASHSVLPAGGQTTVVADANEMLTFDAAQSPADPAAGHEAAAASSSSPDTAAGAAAARNKLDVVIGVLAQLSAIGLQALRVVHGLFVVPPAAVSREQTMSHVP